MIRQTQRACNIRPILGEKHEQWKMSNSGHFGKKLPFSFEGRSFNSRVHKNSQF